jgi:hypothetical protein
VGNYGRPGEADEEAAPQGAGDTFYLLLERRRVRDASGEDTIGGVVAPVGNVRVVRVARLRTGALQSQVGFAAQRGQIFEGDFPAEGLDLDR